MTNKPRQEIIDGNHAASYSAYQTNEVCAIYPITPSSPMGELADEWAAKKEKNMLGTIPDVVEMQSEGGASAAVHGALQTGALTTTFTASQGLLLMIPSMFKIAGELTPTVFHIAARSLAAQALSIFGDHNDVMAVRDTGFALLASSNPQEAHDLALIAQAATLESRVPFIHFFDGFRTSHELQKVDIIPDEVFTDMIDEEWILAHRKRALNAENPVIRGTSQNPDVYFQGRESVNQYYLNLPGIVERAMNKFEKNTKRKYHLVNYIGDPEAERVIILMGSGAETAIETIEHLNKNGEKVGVMKIHLFHPFPTELFLNLLPKAVKSIAVLDRTKEPGSIGEPLYLNVSTALAYAMHEHKWKNMPKIIGGRYGLSSKEFTPAMVKAVFDELKKDNPKNEFTIGIEDDVTHMSLSYDPSFITEDDSVHRALFFGLGSDGTVGGNKNTIKIIGENTDLNVQGYFVYDSKKAGAKTVSHLRFGPNPIHSTYLITSANFIGCHQFTFVNQLDMLNRAAPGATFLLNSPYDEKEVWDHLPRLVQEQIIKKKIKFYVIDAYKLSHDLGLAFRINTIMQTCFFKIANVIPFKTAVEKIKDAIKKSYSNKGEKIVQMNIVAVDQALDHLHEVNVPDKVTSTREFISAITNEAPPFVKNVTKILMEERGDELPVSAIPCDGTFPTGTTKWETRNIANYVPCWDPEVCIQCGICTMVCPHAVIRAKKYDKSKLDDAPETLKSIHARMSKDPDEQYTLQIYVEDCTGCGVCVQNCPAKNKAHDGKKAINMTEKKPILEEERKNVEFFKEIPEADITALNPLFTRDIQYMKPLFEFSGACAGCGETPYIKLISQLFGDRMIVANATGCSSIYGGNLPTTPWTTNTEGHGPSWNNSLFEDAAEFGLGFRLAEDKHCEEATELLQAMSDKVGAELANALMNAKQVEAADFIAQRARIAALKEKLNSIQDPKAKQLLSLANHFLKHSIWSIGGDGWAYDIGFGGLDHTIATGRNINLLVLDTQVYSNTGGQSSKATPIGAVAKFAFDGKKTPRKDLGLIAMSYGYVYVAQIAMGANPAQTIKAIKEAEAYDGPSLIIAYSHCVAHVFDLRMGMDHQKTLVQSGLWPLYRYNPTLIKEGKNPFQLDSKAPSIPVEDFRKTEMRFKSLEKSDPEEAERLMKQNQEEVNRRWKHYEHLAKEDFS